MRATGRRRAIAVVVASAAAAYAWWTSGLEPFTTPAYVAVAAPVTALAVTAVILPRRTVADGRAPAPRPASPDPGAPPRHPVTLARAAPWLALFAAGLALELTALALGGRSPTVPTLSTVVDHALAWRATRAALVVVWLAVGWWPAWLAVRAARAARGAREPNQ